MSKYLIPFPVVGEAYAGQEFGYFVALEAGRIVSAQATTSFAPSGDDFTCDLISSTGVEQGLVATIPDGEYDEPTTFATPLTVTIGQIFRCKVLTAGAATGVLVNYVFEPTTVTSSTADSATVATADYDTVAPTTDNLCSCADPDNPDLGREYSAPVAPSNELPTWTVAGGATISFVDDEPVGTLDT